MAETTTTDSRIPAFEIFKAYFARFFDNVEAEAPWLQDLYNTSQKYYAQGATEYDIPDLLLTDANTPASYKARFAGIEMLKKRQAQGQVVSHIPSVAEYAALSQQMKQEFNRYGLNDLGNQDNIAKIIGNDVDIVELNDRLSTAFMAIDNADQYLKKELATNFPSLGRTDLARALLTGPEGAKELKKKIDIAGIKAGAAEFGMQTQANAEELYKMGVDRQQARAGYQRSAQELAGLEAQAQRIGKGDNLAASLEQENVLGKTSGTVKQLRSQARAQFAGTSGISDTSLKRKRSNLV